MFEIIMILDSSLDRLNDNLTGTLVLVTENNECTNEA